MTDPIPQELRDQLSDDLTAYILEKGPRGEEIIRRWLRMMRARIARGTNT